MSEEIIDGSATAGAGQRPTFLTVLCILTWIGSGLGLLGLMAEGAKYQPAWYNILIVVLNLATAYGAYMMWNLKKQGLMIYTAAEVTAAVLPLIFVFAILPSGSLLQSAAMTMAMIMAIFPIAFIIMYWANAKHLH